MKILLLTGSTGFVGGKILELLDVENYKEKYGFDKIRLFVRTPSKLDQSSIKHLDFEVVKGDLLDHESIRQAAKDVDIVIHVAAIYDTSSSKDRFYSANVEGTRVLMQNLEEGAKFILTSTYGVYGLDTPPRPISEDYEPKKPVWHYQQSKAAQENLAFELGEEMGIEITAIRPPTVIGPGDYFTLPGLVAAVKSGDAAFVRKDGGNKLTYGHVHDVAMAHVLALEQFDKAKGEAFNVQGFAPTFKEIVEGIRSRLKEETPEPRSLPYTLVYALGWMSDVLRLPLPLTRFEAKYIGSTSNLDTSKIEKTLGWTAKYTDFDDAMDETMNWYNEENPTSRV